MAKRKQTKQAVPSIEKLLRDEFVQEQFRNAAHGMREAYVRVRAQRGRAVEDKRLYGDLDSQRHPRPPSAQAPAGPPRPEARPDCPGRRGQRVVDGEDAEA